MRAGHAASTLRKQRTDRKWDKAIEVSRPAPSDPLPSVSLHLITVSQPLETAPPVDDQGFIYINLWGTVLIPTTVGEVFPGVFN